MTQFTQAGLSLAHQKLEEVLINLKQIRRIKIGKVIKQTIQTKENIHLHPEYQNGNTSILFGANLVKQRQTEKNLQNKCIELYNKLKTQKHQSKYIKKRKLETITE